METLKKIFSVIEYFFIIYAIMVLTFLIPSVIYYLIIVFLGKENIYIDTITIISFAFLGVEISNIYHNYKMKQECNIEK